MKNHVKKVGKINLKLAIDNDSKFFLGKIDITDGIRSKGFTMDTPELKRAFDDFVNCKWGCGIPDGDMEINNRSIKIGFGDIMGEYFVHGIKVWIKTDLNQNTVTTILLPEEW